MAFGETMTDVSNPEQPDLSQQIEALKQQLAHAQKMSTLGELVSTTTHEFNNVLMTIINYAKMGMRHKDTPTRDKAFEKILAAGQRAAKITNTVLGIARNQSGSLESTDLVKLIKDSLILLEREMNKYRITLECYFDNVPEVMANGNQIQQVFVNLLVNARQAMKERGRIILKITHDAESNTVDLQIRDTGAGMSQDQLRRIFDPYFTTKKGPDESGKGGTGLGLSSCREIIEAHKGRIQVASTMGKGTAFIIKLPVAVPKTPPTSPGAAPVVPTNVASPIPVSQSSN